MVRTATKSSEASSERPSTVSDFPALRDLPPSAKLVAKSLELDGPATHSGLVENTLLPARTVSFALSRLQDADIIEERPTPRDPRKTMYDLP